LSYQESAVGNRGKNLPDGSREFAVGDRVHAMFSRQQLPGERLDAVIGGLFHTAAGDLGSRNSVQPPVKQLLSGTLE
jgi:hypothetical protein